MSQSPGTSSSPLLHVDQVTVRFGGIVALDGVSLEVHQGEICALIGPNGAGKSTLFNCLSRLYPCDSGSIYFNGQAIHQLPRHRMAGLGLGRTFQNLAMFRSMTVCENILVGQHRQTAAGFFRHALRWWGVAAQERLADDNAQQLIALLALQDVAESTVADLPFGIQKRVELARALATQPQLLLLDEPACGLNHEELQTLSDTIRRIRDEMGVTVLLVEHHMGLVMGLSDRVVALNFGKKIAEGTPAQVRQHPEVIRAYLGDVEEAA